MLHMCVSQPIEMIHILCWNSYTVVDDGRQMYLLTILWTISIRMVCVFINIISLQLFRSNNNSNSTRRTCHWHHQLHCWERCAMYVIHFVLGIKWFEMVITHDDILVSHTNLYWVKRHCISIIFQFDRDFTGVRTHLWPFWICMTMFSYCDNMISDSKKPTLRHHRSGLYHLMELIWNLKWHYITVKFYIYYDINSTRNNQHCCGCWCWHWHYSFKPHTVQQCTNTYKYQHIVIR